MTLLQGKVKTVFELEDPGLVLIQYEDKVTAGNGKREAFVEGKGEVCCEISFLSKSPDDTLKSFNPLARLSPWVPFPDPGGPNNIIFTYLFTKFCFLY